MACLTAIDAAAHLTRDRRQGVRAKLGLALAGASALGLAHLVRPAVVCILSRAWVGVW